MMMRKFMNYDRIQSCGFEGQLRFLPPPTDKVKTPETTFTHLTNHGRCQIEIFPGGRHDQTDIA